MLRIGSSSVVRVSTSTGFDMGFLAFLAGAKRWFNPEMAKAVAIVGVAICFLIGGALLHTSGQSSGGAKRDASWLQRLNAATALAMKRRSEQDRAVRDAVAKSLQQVEAERDEAVKRAAAIATELASLKDDPVVYPRQLAKEMSK